MTAKVTSEEEFIEMDEAPLGVPPDLARKLATKRFADALAARGMTEMASATFAAAVVDPAEARRKLLAPSELRVPGATLEFITVSAWAPRLATNPANAREAASHVLPITGQKMEYKPLHSLRSLDGRPELTVEVDSAEQLVAALNGSRTFLLEHNDYRDSVSLQGVLMPLTVVALTVTHADGRPPTCLPIAEDGSSRIATTHEILEVVPEDIAYAYPLNDRRFRQLVGVTRSLLDQPALTPREQAKVRALTVPASFIVGLKPPLGQANLTLDMARAVTALVGQVHVDPPKAWGPGAELDVQGEAILTEFIDLGAINEDERGFFAGLMTRQEARAAGLTDEFDERAATILRLSLNNLDVVKRGIRRVVPRPKIAKTLVADVAAELSMRAYRSSQNAGDAHTSRVALQRVFRRYSTSKAITWAITGRSPEQLRDAALTELNQSTMGPAAAELALLAAFHLTREHVLRRPDRAPMKGAGGQLVADKREPDVVLLELARTRRGIHFLCQSLIDGRGGVKPRRVDESGAFVFDAASRAREATHEWIRLEASPEEVNGEEPMPALDQTLTEPIETKLARARASYARHVEIAEADLGNIKTVLGASGQPAIDDLGWPIGEADDLLRRLEHMKGSLYGWRARWTVRNNVSDDAEDDVNGEVGA